MISVTHTHYITNCILIFSGAVPFPEELQKYGLSEETLEVFFKQVLTESIPSWTLRGMIPNVKFYQTLHSFLKKWPVTRTASKMAIGKLLIKT